MVGNPTLQSAILVMGEIVRDTKVGGYVGLAVRMGAFFSGWK